MKIVLHLSQDFPEIAVAEASILLEAVGVKHRFVGVEPPLAYIETPDQVSISYTELTRLIDYVVWRSALIRRGLLCLDPVEVEGVIRELGPKSFAIHIHVYRGEYRERDRDIDSLARLVQKSGVYKVSLRDPEVVVARYIVGRESYMGIEFHHDKKSFSRRRPSSRPVFSPFSLDPKLARMLINLSGAPRGSIVYDPFCGVGGIPIEAESIGLSSICVELVCRWARGARVNIDGYSPSSWHDVICGDSFDKFIRMGGLYLATDPPYGRITKTSKESIEVYERLVNDIAIFARGSAFFTHVDIDHIIEDSGVRMLFKFKIPVHSNLTRYLYVLR